MRLSDSHVFLGFGGNLGDVRKTIQQAIEALTSRDGISLIQMSSFYRTEPLYDANQPDFINAVARFAVRLSPRVLLRIIHQTEETFGRVRNSKRRYAPRTLDIDILFWGDETICQKNLIVPHREFAERKFVLEPMGEIALNYTVPGTEKTIRDFLNECPDQSRVEKI
ncbi:MAG: 2-amino-4-hydroxy-6-hydroxymethyldihydropteridine diphosphokinase [Candidatus Neomarinimicrobiota bacterium]|nr:2-amino-4-hydroxy-6-hydroxymethyldihydropteridine diphosphokinase [Candidatus Neomarinimicrobiota bacterium]RKY51056.1 MAG: 2-amino-4-hydroxy-6-hydroxymethyldihydropteridine diphosphokinase [Candidatus Neomarinimicrobiota bacterium]